MRRSTAKILTTHVGALPGNEAVWTGQASDAEVHGAVTEVIALQRGAGVDVINEGELTKGDSAWASAATPRSPGPN